MENITKDNLERRYQLLLGQSQELLLFFNEKGKILECNKLTYEILGYEEDTLHGNDISDIFRKAIKRDKKGIGVKRRYVNKASETVAYCKNQTCFPVKLKIATRNDEEGFLGICSAVVIIETKRIAKELKIRKHEVYEARKLKNEFVGNITHELKTPVNGILGLAETMLETELTPRQIETMNIIKRSCTHMTDIINDILDFSKIANGKLVLEQREFNFKEFVDNIIQFNINQINQKGLKLFVNMDQNIPEFVIGDEHRLTQVLNNLFSNAIKFTSVGQIVLEIVKTEQLNSQIELFFMMIDTGIGIRKKDQDKLFQSFTQVDGSVTRKYGGTGLGLSICKSIVESMQGSIAVDSELNNGTTFSFTVRLGTKRTQAQVHTRWQQGPHLEQESNIENHNNYQVDGKEDYVAKVLEKANLLNPNWNVKQIRIHQWEQESIKENFTEITVLFEKLVICVEMENWEVAEEIALKIRGLLPKGEYQELQKKVFQFILLIRKEEHEKSIILLRDIEKIVEEVLKWKR